MKEHVTSSRVGSGLAGLSDGASSLEAEGTRLPSRRQWLSANAALSVALAVPRSPIPWALGGLVGAGSAWGANDVVAALRSGGVVLALRHALAPGTFDPPGFVLGDCKTQRNLSAEGVAQAKRIGEWFRLNGLKPTQVRTSPWCRCIDTANTAFGQSRTWAALGSPRAGTESTNRASLDQLRQALRTLRTQRGSFEVWVTHMFVLSDLVNVSTQVGEGLVLQADGQGGVGVLSRIAIE